MKKPEKFRLVRRPNGVVSRYDAVVVDGQGFPHQALTTFYHELQQYVDEGTARTYLHTLLPYFGYLTADPWRKHRQDQWDSPPQAVKESIRDYLVEWLHCKAQPKDSYQLVRMTAKSPSTVRIFLSALKQFYHIVRHLGWYQYPHPLLDSVTHLMWEVEAEERHATGQRMPQYSGVEEPKCDYRSENYFRLVEGEWKPQPIDDPELHKRLRQGFALAQISLRDQIIVRMAYESGARIREILRLNVNDWRKRGANQEAWACSKGSHGRRVKVIRWSRETTKMLYAYVNTERKKIDPLHRDLGLLDGLDPLFVSNRGKPYDYDAFKKHWYRLCTVVQMDLNIHALRHWYTTQQIRLICETAQTPGEVERGKEDLVRYMAWRSPDTLRAYEHYFNEQRHAVLQDRLHTQWHEALLRSEKEAIAGSGSLTSLPSTSQLTRRSAPDTDLSSKKTGWEALLMLGGGSHE